MMAEVTIGGDFSPARLASVVGLLTLVGATLFLLNLLSGQAAVSSGLPRRRRRPASSGPAANWKQVKGPGQNDPMERRASPRRGGARVPVLVRSAAPGRPERGSVVDRSRGGLRLVLREPREVGAELSIRATHAPEGLPWVRVVVRHSQRKGERWELGCRFVEGLPWSILLLFG